MKAESQWPAGFLHWVFALALALALLETQKVTGGGRAWHPRRTDRRSSAGHASPLHLWSGDIGLVHVLVHVVVVL
jgi:hypothetical protein